ncbi:MAG TPA: hypothetical protein VK074_10405, partial [Fodinibius sp.]|nr:hypothetical protein [Fodinibius sp.]
MKPQFVKLNSDNRKAFNVSYYDVPHFGDTWHFHSKFELTYIIKSAGIQFIGDSIENFRSGNLVLIGPNIPHMWNNNEEYYRTNSNHRAQAIVIHFERNFAGKDFLNLSEIRQVKTLLEDASQGLRIKIRDNFEIIEKFRYLNSVSPDSPKKIAAFISVLCTIAEDMDYNYLCSPGYVETFQTTKDERLANILEYIMSNFKNEITLNEVAKIACMTETSFCRYFKQKTRKNFIQLLHEIRVGYACKLLL